MKKLRILVADDHGLVRRGIREILRERRNWKIAGEAGTGREAVEKARALQPDVVVLDIGMPEMNGIEAAREIREAAPEARILMLTMHESDQMVERAMQAGAHGYVLKSDLTETLGEAVEQVCAGARYLGPKVSEIIQDKNVGEAEHRRRPRAGMRATPRETEILRLLATGKTNRETAELLGVSCRTIESHRANMMMRLGLHSLPELVYYALHHGLIEPHETMAMEVAAGARPRTE